MKKIMSTMLGLSLILGAATLTFAADDDKTKTKGKDKAAAKDKTKKTDKKKKAATDKTDKKS